LLYLFLLKKNIYEKEEKQTSEIITINTE